MTDKRIAVSAMEANAIGQQLAEFNALQETLKEKGNALQKSFRVLCGARGLPENTQLVGVSQKEIVVKLPKQKSRPHPNPATRR